MSDTTILSETHAALTRLERVVEKMREDGDVDLRSVLYCIRDEMAGRQIEFDEVEQ